MKRDFIYGGILIILMLCSFVVAGPFRVSEHMDMLGNDIYNVTNVNATNINGNGSGITGLTGSQIGNMDIKCSANTFVTATNFTGESLTCTGISDVYLLNNGDNGTGNYAFSSGTFDVETLNTGQGDYELYAMNQDVESTDTVTFATVDTGQGANELYDMDQNVLTTSSPSFVNLTVDCKIGINSSHFTCYNASGTIFECAGCGIPCVCS